LSPSPSRFAIVGGREGAAWKTAPPITLKLFLGALAAGVVLLVPSFLYLFRVFGKVRRTAAS